MNFDFAYLLDVAPELAWATFVTIYLAIAGYIVALVLGLVFALLRLSSNRWVARGTLGFCEFVRLTPLLVQLFFAFYVLPAYGIRIGAEVTGIIVIGLHYATYTAEVYRAGIQAVERGQWEATRALGLRGFVVWREVVLPLAIPPMVPALGNYMIQLFKEVPLLSTITVYELLNTANLLANRSFRYVEVLTAVGLIFFAISFPAARLFRWLDARHNLPSRRS